jgi:hypothetical protein
MQHILQMYTLHTCHETTQVTPPCVLSPLTIKWRSKVEPCNEVLQEISIYWDKCDFIYDIFQY